MELPVREMSPEEKTGLTAVSEDSVSTNGLAKAAKLREVSRGDDEYVETPLDYESDAPSGNSTELFDDFDEPTAEDLEDPEIKALESYVIHESDIYHVDALTQFLRVAERHDLLTATQEVSLAKQMEEGRAAEAKLKPSAKRPAGKRLSKQDKIQLHAQVELGRAARSEMVNCNLRLVVSVVKRYMGFGVDIADLVQEGNIGLIRAVEKFDWRKGFKFSTYATWWIRQAAQRANANYSRNIRIPSHVNDRIIKLSIGRQRFIAEHGFEPDDVELSDYTSVSIQYIHEAEEALKRQTTSLNRLVGDSDDPSEIGDLFDSSRNREGQNGPDTAGEAEKSLMAGWMRGVLVDLPKPARQVIELRYGLNDDVPRTLAETGKVMGFSREKATNLEKRAMELLADRIDPGWVDVLVGEEETNSAEIINPADALKRHGLPALGSLDDIKSFIGHQLLKGRKGETIAEELGVTYTVYKKCKKEMYQDLSVESERHSELIQELGKRKVAVQKS